MDIKGFLFSLVKPAAPSGSVNLPFQYDVNGPNVSVSVSAPVLVGDAGSGGSAGLAPAPAAGDGAAKKWLKATGVWAAIVAADLTGAVFGASGGSHSAGAVPDPGSSAGTTRFLREDSTWGTPSGTVTSLTTTGTSGPATFTSGVLNIPQYGGGGGGGTASITVSAASNPSTLNVTTEGTSDWLVTNGSTTLPRVMNGLVHSKIEGKTGAALINSFDWVGGNNAVNLFAQNFTNPAVSSTGSDDVAGALSSSVAGQGIFSPSGGAVGYGFRLAVPALAASRTLRIYASVFSGVMTCKAAFADGSVSPVTATVTASAGTANEGYFTITFTGAEQGSILYVTVLLTTNSGSSPNIKFMAATLA